VSEAAEASGETVWELRIAPKCRLTRPEKVGRDGFGGDEPVKPLLPPLTGSCPASSMRRSRANCRDARIWFHAGLPCGVYRVDRGEGGAVVEDENILKRINELAAEEHELFQRESRGEATEEDVERLRHLEVTLDQSWDLLHQRRARRDAGLDPDEAKVRDERTVEGYVN
jgi:hypothetical protein